MFPYTIVFIWATFIIVYSAKANEPTGIILGLSATKEYQRTEYTISRQENVSTSTFISSPTATPCLIETAALHASHKLDEISKAWNAPYRIYIFPLHQSPTFHLTHQRSCKSLGLNLLQF